MSDRNEEQLDAVEDDGERDHVALEVLCRVFDDGADVAMEEWREWYKPEQWLGWERALGAFIRGRIERQGPRPVSWYEQRHVQMAKRLRNYRNGIRQLQRAYAVQASHCRTLLSEFWKYRDQIRNLRRELDASRANEAKPWWGYVWAAGLVFVASFGAGCALLWWLGVPRQ